MSGGCEGLREKAVEWSRRGWAEQASRKTVYRAGPRPWMFPLCDAEKATQLFYP